LTADLGMSRTNGGRERADRSRIRTDPGRSVAEPKPEAGDPAGLHSVSGPPGAGMGNIASEAAVHARPILLPLHILAPISFPECDLDIRGRWLGCRTCCDPAWRRTTRSLAIVFLLRIILGIAAQAETGACSPSPPEAAPMLIQRAQTSLPYSMCAYTCGPTLVLSGGTHARGGF